MPFALNEKCITVSLSENTTKQMLQIWYDKMHEPFDNTASVFSDWQYATTEVQHITTYNLARQWNKLPK